jgi:flagellar motor component MotA
VTRYHRSQGRAALVGTFLGILAASGFVGPIAAGMSTTFNVQP